MFTPGPCYLSPATPAGYAELLIRGRISRVRGKSIDTPRDLGASAIEWVVISALLVAIAVAVGGILIGKLRAKATSINLDQGI